MLSCEKKKKQRKITISDKLSDTKKKEKRDRTCLSDSSTEKLTCQINWRINY